MNEMIKMILVTTVICAFSATLLGGLKEGLEDRIARQEDFYIRGPAIKSLLNKSPNDPLQDRVTITLNAENINIYPWIEEGKVRRIAVERPGKGGYGGDVIVMTAIDLETRKIFGVEVTQHKETPGVGTRAMTPGFLEKFMKLPLTQTIALKSAGGQIDAVSGATRSSAGVTDAVNQAISLVRDNKETIVKEVLKNARGA